MLKQGKIANLGRRRELIRSLFRRLKKEKFSKKLSISEVFKIPVTSDVDVAVVGGGISGIISAICAARSGTKTLLIEQQGCLGGLGTLGFIPPISNQFFDASGKQITKGIADEFMDRLASAGGITLEWRDWRIPKYPFDIEIFKLIAYEMLEEAGVSIMLNSFFSKAIVENGKIGNIIIENRMGRQAIQSKIFIDCTGSAAVAISAGAPSNINADLADSDSIKGVTSSLLKRIGWEKRTEKTSSLQLAISGVDFERLYNHVIHNPDGFDTYFRGELKEDIELFKYLWDNKGIFYIPHTRNFEKEIQKALSEGFFKEHAWRYWSISECGVSIDGLRSNGILTITANKVLIDPFSEDDITKALIKGQEVCFEIWRFFKEYIPGFENSVLIAVAPLLGIRRAAQIIGKRILTVQEREEERKYADVIGMYSRKTKNAREIPFFCTVPKNITNLLVGSGKSVSTDDFVMYRTKPHCMIIGQAVGVAAALCVKKKVANHNLDTNLLQFELLRQGVYLGEMERLQELGLKGRE